MKRRNWMIVIMVLVLVAGVSYSVVSFAGKKEQAESRKKKLERERAAILNEIEEIEKDKTDVMKYIEKLDNKMKKLEGKSEDLNKDIKATNKVLEELQTRLSEAETTAQRQYDTMKKRIKYMYENGSGDYMDALLRAKSVSDLLNRTEYIEKISAYDRNMLKNYRTTKDQIAADKAEVEKQLAELTALQDELKVQTDSVEKLAANKEKELKKYETTIDDNNEQVTAYSEQISKQEDIIAAELLKEQQRILKQIQEQKQKEADRKRREELAKATPTPAAGTSETEGTATATPAAAEKESEVKQIESADTSTGFSWPLGSAGRITSTFGRRNSPTAGASSYHKGIDIGIETGTPILASAAGTVVTATYQSAAGNYIMLYHNGTTFSVYMHCSKLAVVAGTTVKKGQVIGYVGSTGVSTGSHLHFGISVSGAYVDPLAYVRQP